MKDSIQNKEVKTNKKLSSKDKQRLICWLLVGVLIFSTFGSVVLSIM